MKLNYYLGLAMSLALSVAMGFGVTTAQAADTARAAAAAAEAGPSIAGPAAHWVKRKLDYTYLGFTTKYSCDGLLDKVREVLLALGARKKDLTIQSSGCIRPDGPEPFPGIAARFSVLVPVAPEDIGKPADSTVQPTLWRTVDLVRLHGFAFDQGQCELLAQLEKKALPLFTSRNLHFRSSCTPHQISPGDIQFSLDVLRPAPPRAAPAHPGQVPPGGL